MITTASTVKYGTATLVLICSIYIAIHRQSVDVEWNEQVLTSLRRAEKKAPVKPAKVAVGFGACIDVFVKAVPLMTRMGVAPPKQGRHHNKIKGLKDLSEGFAYFFRHGAAAERYVTNTTLFTDIVKEARALKGARSAIGGNAAVMANRLAIEGADVLLAAQTSDEVTKLLWPGVKFAGPEAENPDVHLLMEYATGQKWGPYTAERANRFIIHSDQYNPTIGSLEPLRERLISFDPKLLIVSGLQMMDNFPFKSGEREQRLSSLRNLLQAPPGNTNPLVHFELASFVEESLVTDLIDYIVPYVDSFGMNEQELPNLESALKYGNVTILSDAYPRVASVLDQMRAVYKLLRTRYKRVTRIHVHTLAFQAIMTREGSGWKNTMSAAAHASLTAHRHVCGTKMVDLANSKLLMDKSFSKTLASESGRVLFQPDKPVSCWDEAYSLDGKDSEKVLICIAPNLVCTQVQQTAGGGDNISSAGLAVQI